MSCLEARVQHSEDVGQVTQDRGCGALDEDVEVVGVGVVDNDDGHQA